MLILEYVYSRHILDAESLDSPKGVHSDLGCWRAAAVACCHLSDARRRGTAGSVRPYSRSNTTVFFEPRCKRRRQRHGKGSAIASQRVASYYGLLLCNKLFIM